MKMSLHYLRSAALLFSFFVLNTESGLAQGGVVVKPKSEVKPESPNKSNGENAVPNEVADSMTVTTATKTDAVSLNYPGKIVSKRSLKERESPKPVTQYPGQTDTMVTTAYNAALKSYYYALERKNVLATSSFDASIIHDGWALENRRKVIERQQAIGILIFALVVLVVFSGLVFSAMQFRIAIKNFKKKGVAPDTSFKASLSGIEVSSSILGVIILALSIIFFYLYLINVFPIVTLRE